MIRHQEIRCISEHFQLSCITVYQTDHQWNVNQRVHSQRALSKRLTHPSKVYPSYEKRFRDIGISTEFDVNQSTKRQVLETSFRSQLIEFFLADLWGTRWRCISLLKCLAALPWVRVMEKRTAVRQSVGTKPLHSWPQWEKNNLY